MRFRIQHFRLMRIRIPLYCSDDQKMKNFTAVKSSSFLPKNCNLFFVQKEPSALKKHLALENMKFINFFLLFLGSFLPSWIRIQIRILIADPDPSRRLKSVRKRTSSTLKHEIYSHFSIIFGIIFAFLDSDPDPHFHSGSRSRRPKPRRIWIHNMCF
jgi:hypothetical protein